MLKAIRAWKYKRFLKTLPPMFSRDPEFIRNVFRRDCGREFDPFNWLDREAVRAAISKAMISQLPKLFEKSN